MKVKIFERRSKGKGGIKKARRRAPDLED